MLFNINPESKVLLLAPHTDDVEIAAGGLVNKIIEKGVKAFYVAFSDCKESLPKGYASNTLRKECYEATRKLGICEENVEIKDYPVRQFAVFRQNILDDLITIRSELKPDLVIVPSLKDNHQDHQIVAQEAVRAFKNTTILAYQFDWNCLELTRNFFVNLNEKDLRIKIDALSSYKSQKHRKYFSNRFIENHASVIGAQFGFEYAEAFEIVRMVMPDAEW